MNPNVDWYFPKNKRWQAELEKLRILALDCNLTEELKWGCPCYTDGKTNIVLIHCFKEYCALLFFKGALMKDAKKWLIQQTENVQAARQLRFTSLQEIAKKELTIKAYIKEAIRVEKSGLKVEFKQTTEFKMVEEFDIQLKKNASLKKSFYALTPGRQRGYLLHFASAKQAKTRESRIEKCIPQILKGKGLDD